MRRVRQALLWGFIASSCVCVLLLARAGAQVATKPVTRLVGHRAIAITASGDAVLRDDGRVIGFNNRNKEAEGPIFIRGLRGIIDVAGASEDGLGPNWPKGSAYWIALRRSGEVLQWNGHCSDEGIYSCSFSRATVVPLPRKVAVIASAGGTHLAIDSEGQAWGWGLDHDGLITGQKGERDPSGRLIPRLIERPIKIPLSAPLKYIAIGFPHSIGIDRKGTVWLWGAHNDQNFLPKDTETYTNGKFVARKVLNIPPVQSAVAD